VRCPYLGRTETNHRRPLPRPRSGHSLPAASGEGRKGTRHAAARAPGPPPTVAATSVSRAPKPISSRVNISAAVGLDAGGDEEEVAVAVVRRILGRKGIETTRPRGGRRPPSVCSVRADCRVQCPQQSLYGQSRRWARPTNSLSVPAHT
jgi:hypothetical protein